MADILSSASHINIKITSNDGEEFDVSEIFVVGNIYQSLFFKKFITGRIVLLDTNDIMSLIPLVGFEDVTIHISNSYDQNFHDYKFKIYKIDKDIGTFDLYKRSKILNIYLYSEEEFNNYTKISKKFTGTGSSIITKLLSENLKSTKMLTSIPDSSLLKFNSNFWNAERCIEYICDNVDDEYLFYENNDGFHFEPLSYLFEQIPLNSLNFSPDNVLNDYDNVLKYQFNSHFDDLLWRKRGTFGTTSYTLDKDNYGFEVKSDDISKIDKQLSHCGGIKKMYNDQTDDQNDIFVVYQKNEKNRKLRTTQFNLMSRYNLVVKIEGDISRNVGKVYTINIPSIGNDPVASDSFSGDYLISEINTEFSANEKMHQNISFVRNALNNNPKLKNI